MNKIFYEEPEMEVFRYGVEDAIATSVSEPDELIPLPLPGQVD